MAQVVTFEGYTPVARYDDVPWTDVRIEEAEAETGPWTEVETIALSPVDDDPAHPAVRNFTTELASDGVGLWYRVIFIDATDDESLPSDPVQNGTAASIYVTIDDLKAFLRITSSEADSQVQEACEVASRVIDSYKRTRYYPTSETNYYTPARGDCEINIDELTGSPTVTVDMVGNGSYTTTWTQGTDFYLEPVNNPNRGWPYRTLVLRYQSGAFFPGYQHALKITGSFGWSTTPAQIRKAAELLAARLYSRRDAVFGILAIGSVDTIAMRLPKTDPDISTMLDSVDSLQPRLVA